MESGLYETLNLPKSATQDEIRKAYRTRALQTHPDRIQEGTPRQKAAAEEEFRKVNHAYEVLSDPQRRQAYDRHGQWPPPSSAAMIDDPFVGPFSARPFMGGPMPPFSRGTSSSFTDPFSIFNTVFPGGPGDDPSISEFRRDPFSAPSPRRGSFAPMSMSMSPRLSPSQQSAWDTFPQSGMRGPSGPHFEATETYSTEGFGFPATGRWSNESHSMQSVNGVTASVRKRTDFDGNEHITRTYPDGREVITINGVEQVQRSIRQ